MEKITSYIIEYKRDLAFSVIIFFVASLSFALGYAAGRQFNHSPIIIEKCSYVTNP